MDPQYVGDLNRTKNTVNTSWRVLFSLAQTGSSSYTESTRSIVEKPRGNYTTGYSDRELLESFYLHCQLKGLRRRTLKCYADRLRYLMRFCLLSGIHLGVIQQSHIQSYLVSIIGHVSPETVNGRIRVFRVFYNYLASEDLIDHNPMERVHLMSVEQRIMPVLKPIQIGTFLQQFNRRRFTGYRDHLASLLMLDACLRVGEIINLTVDDCRILDRLLVVRGKSRRERLVPISPRTAEAIHHWRLKYRDKRAGDRLICYKNGDPMSEDRIRKIVVAAGKKVGLKVYPHMLRRSGATALHENGMDIEMLRRVLGHQDIRTTQRYICHDVKAVKESHDRFSIMKYVDMGRA